MSESTSEKACPHCGAVGQLHEHKNERERYDVCHAPGCGRSSGHETFPQPPQPQRKEPAGPQPRGTRLARRVVDLLAALEDTCAIERCSHGGCRRLAAGEPDFGPNVEAAVCEEHVPRGAVLIGCQEEVTDALRALFKELAKYGHRFDPATGRPL